MKSDKTRELVILSLYAALIIVSVQFIRIPFGPQFVHLGNALRCASRSSRVRVI